MTARLAQWRRRSRALVHDLRLHHAHREAGDEIDEAEDDEKIARGPKSASVIYWQVPKNHTLDSTIGKTMGKKRYKSSTTTRNIRTLAKVLR